MNDCTKVLRKAGEKAMEMFISAKKFENQGSYNLLSTMRSIKPLMEAVPGNPYFMVIF